MLRVEIRNLQNMTHTHSIALKGTAYKEQVLKFWKVLGKSIQNLKIKGKKLEKSIKCSYIFYFLDNFLENFKEQVSNILKIRNRSI